MEQGSLLIPIPLLGLMCCLAWLHERIGDFSPPAGDCAYMTNVSDLAQTDWCDSSFVDSPDQGGQRHLLYVKKACLGCMKVDVNASLWCCPLHASVTYMC